MELNWLWLWWMWLLVSNIQLVWVCCSCVEENVSLMSGVKGQRRQTGWRPLKGKSSSSHQKWIIKLKHNDMIFFYAIYWSIFIYIFYPPFFAATLPAATLSDRSERWLFGLAPVGDLGRNALSTTSASGLSGATEHVPPGCFFLSPPLLPHERNLSVSDKEGVYSPKWVGCSQRQKTTAATLASFSSAFRYATHCSRIVMDVGKHKALLWANYATENAAFCRILDSVRIVELCLVHFGRDERVLSGKNRRVSVWTRSPGQFLLLATSQESPHLLAQRLNTPESASCLHL